MERAVCEYTNESGRFVFKSKKDFDRQFDGVYTSRLAALRDAAVASLSATAATAEAAPLTRILDLTPGAADRCIAGTVVKTMPLLPNLLKEYAAARVIGGFRWDRTQYASDADTLALEDETGRVRLAAPPELVAALVNGAVVAVVGRFAVAADAGVFEVAQVAAPNVPPQRPIAAAATTAGGAAKRRVLFVSGLNVGGDAANPLGAELLADWVAGRIGGAADHALAASVARVVVAGNSVHCPKEDDAGAGAGAFVMQSQRQLTQATGLLRQLETVLVGIAASCPLDLMPGPTDPASNALPQQPMSRVLFPAAGVLESFAPVPNPYHCVVDGRHFLGSAGQNVDNVLLTSGITDRLLVLQRMLEWRLIAPTAPDTLCCLPFEKDPMLLEECPHVFFAGNQPEFGTRIFEGPQGQRVCLLLVPDFAATSTAVLVDVDTLEATPLLFSTS